MYVLAVLALIEGSALAGASGTADVACGTAPAGWNAPNGAIVSNRGSGPIRAVIDAVGEYRTHTMLSHGAGSGAWVTHHTMHTPGTTGWPTYCSTPVNHTELRTGYPGGSQVTQGAIYTHMFGNGGQEFTGYQRSMTNGQLTDHGADAANWTWNYFPYQWVTSKKDSGQGLYRLKNDAGALLTYTLYQYRNMESVNASTASTWQNGMHCTTLASHIHYRAGKGVVASHTYSHAQIVNAGNTLKNAVENDCNNNLGFWSGLGASITCFEGICDDAARQTANCFTDGINGSCYTDDSQYYTRVRDANLAAGSWSGWNKGPYDQSGYATASAISPDAIGGWNGHAWGTAAPHPVWSADGNNTAQWNSSGNVYGCFF